MKCEQSINEKWLKNMIKNNLILGLDISTTTIGFNIIKNNINSDIIKFGFIKPNLYVESKDSTIYTDNETLIFKCIYSVNEIKKILIKYPDIKYVFLEDSLKNFATGKTKANVKIMLITINNIIYYELWKEHKYIIQKIHPSTARKLAIGKSTNKSFKKPTPKRFAMCFLIKKYGKSFYKQLPRMKRKDKLSKEAFDISDSLIISLSCQKKYLK